MLNKNTVGRLVLPLILIVILLSIPAPILAEEGIESSYDIFYFMEIMDIIEENYVYDISKEELIEGAIKGLFYKLDSHSQYYTKEEFQRLIELTTGDFVGIGVYINDSKGHVEIIEPIEGGPAYENGIKSGDIILEVDGQKVEGFTADEVAQLIRGKAGTLTRIKIKRGNRILIYSLEREVVQINPIKYTILNEDIAYIKISEFNEHTSDNLEKALKEIDKKKINNIIIDLRNNPGGLLMEAVRALEFFVPEGPLVHIGYKNGTVETLYSSLKKPKYNLAVLINENSASASEIFAGAVQDTGAGTVIGTTSYGKGTVQVMYQLRFGDGMKITIAEYLTPNKRNINNTGIEPDIVVKDSSKTKDQQLIRAMKFFSSRG